MKKLGKISKLAIKSFFKKPNTISYPKVKSPMSAHFRGKLKFFQDKCIGCKLCMRDCPSDAIRIKKVGDKLFEFEIDLGRCVYCGQCVDTCPKKAIAITTEYELAKLDRKALKTLLDDGTKKKN